MSGLKKNNELYKMMRSAIFAAG